MVTVVRRPAQQERHNRRRRMQWGPVCSVTEVVWSARQEQHSWCGWQRRLEPNCMVDTTGVDEKPENLVQPVIANDKVRVPAQAGTIPWHRKT